MWLMNNKNIRKHDKFKSAKLTLRILRFKQYVLFQKTTDLAAINFLE